MMLELAVSRDVGVAFIATIQRRWSLSIPEGGFTLMPGLVTASPFSVQQMKLLEALVLIEFGRQPVIVPSGGVS